MVDQKIKSLLTVMEKGSFTKAAEELHLTQPAVSHHIRLLEQEFGIKIFKQDKKDLITTPEGEVLIKYARRIMAIFNNARQAIADSQKQAKHLTIGLSQSAGENLMPQVIALYCNEHPHTHIKIVTDTIKNLYQRLELYELDIAVIQGGTPNPKFHSVLLDTDYLCVVVSPQHPFAKRQSVVLRELKDEKLILRPSGASTGMMFNNYLFAQSESMKNFDVIMELDNIPMIKDLVSLNLGISILGRSSCKKEIRQGKLAVVPIDNARMTTEVTMVYQQDFTHLEILEDLKRIYGSLL